LKLQKILKKSGLFRQNSLIKSRNPQLATSISSGTPQSSTIYTTLRYRLQGIPPFVLPAYFLKHIFPTDRPLHQKATQTVENVIQHAK